MRGTQKGAENLNPILLLSIALHWMDARGGADIKSVDKSTIWVDARKRERKTTPGETRVGGEQYDDLDKNLASLKWKIGIAFGCGVAIRKRDSEGGSSA